MDTLSPLRLNAHTTLNTTTMLHTLNQGRKNGPLGMGGSSAGPYSGSSRRNNSSVLAIQKASHQGIGGTMTRE